MPDDMGMVFAEVRATSKPEKLLFELGIYRGDIVILLKPHGDERHFIIPFRQLLEPCFALPEELRKELRDFDTSTTGE